MSEKPQYKIYIDSTERYEKSVILVKVENNKETEIAKKEGDIDIVAAIDEVLTSNNLTPSDIKEYIPNKGPGSFTGIKIGITVANILNWALGKKELASLDAPNYGKEPNIQITKNK